MYFNFLPYFFPCPLIPPPLHVLSCLLPLRLTLTFLGHIHNNDCKRLGTQQHVHLPQQHAPSLPSFSSPSRPSCHLSLFLLSIDCFCPHCAQPPPPHTPLPLPLHPLSPFPCPSIPPSHHAFFRPLLHTPHPRFAKTRPPSQYARHLPASLSCCPDPFLRDSSPPCTIVSQPSPFLCNMLPPSHSLPCRCCPSAPAQTILSLFIQFRNFVQHAPGLSVLQVPHHDWEAGVFGATGPQAVRGSDTVLSGRLLLFTQHWLFRGGGKRV